MISSTFKPTTKMDANPTRGFELREKYGCGGSDVSIHRVEQLAAQRDLTAEDVKSKHSPFAHYEAD